jgi:hypothetical protein
VHQPDTHEEKGQAEKGVQRGDKKGREKEGWEGQVREDRERM